MSSGIVAQDAVRAWVNSKPGLVGTGAALAGGAYLKQQRSPATGAYAVLGRVLTARERVVAESADVLMARVAAQVYHGDEAMAEKAAAALAAAWEGLQGSPEPCGATGVRVLVADNVAGPMFVPQPADSGEIYCFQVAADFMLTST